MVHQIHLVTMCMFNPLVCQTLENIRTSLGMSPEKQLLLYFVMPSHVYRRDLQLDQLTEVEAQFSISKAQVSRVQERLKSWLKWPGMCTSRVCHADGKRNMPGPLPGAVLLPGQGSDFLQLHFRGNVFNVTLINSFHRLHRVLGGRFWRLCRLRWMSSPQTCTALL